MSMFNVQLRLWTKCYKQQHFSVSKWKHRYTISVALFSSLHIFVQKVVCSNPLQQTLEKECYRYNSAFVKVHNNILQEWFRIMPYYLDTYFFLFSNLLIPNSFNFFSSSHFVIFLPKFLFLCRLSKKTSRRWIFYEFRYQFCF